VCARDGTQLVHRPRRHSTCLARPRRTRNKNPTLTARLREPNGLRTDASSLHRDLFWFDVIAGAMSVFNPLFILALILCTKTYAETKTNIRTAHHVTLSLFFLEDNGRDVTTSSRIWQPTAMRVSESKHAMPNTGTHAQSRARDCENLARQRVRRSARTGTAAQAQMDESEIAERQRQAAEVDQTRLTRDPAEKTALLK